MGRIAYLARRGQVWWFRRRHPAIILTQPESVDFSGTSDKTARTGQARGHLAVSLGTTSAREARLLGARLGDHFERAWAEFERKIQAMTMEAGQEILEEMAMNLTKGFRNYTEHYRQLALDRMAPEMRERVFAILDAQLREAIGIAPLPYGSMFKRTEPAPIAYIAMQPAPLDQMSKDQEAFFREAFEKHGDAFTQYGDLVDGEACVAEHIDLTESMLLDPEDGDDADRLESLADGLQTLLEGYLSTCEREGRTPFEDLPAARRIARSLYTSAKRLGLPEAVTPKTVQKAPQKQYSDLPFSKFAEQYLKLRREGYLLKNEDETPHVETGRNFERTSLGNFQSSVRLFTDIAGDLPLADISKDDILDFNAVVQRLPRNHGKSAKDKRNARQVVDDTEYEDEEKQDRLGRELAEEGVPPAEIEDRLAAARIGRISATTVKRHQMAIQAILEYAKSRQLIASNPFKGRVLTDREVKRRKLTEARVQRKGWGDDINTLLQTKIFRQPLESPGEPLFWAPLIAMYAGLRLEEICQLRVRDFGIEEEVHYVAVQNEIGSQFTKSENSIRRVPLHRALIEIGLPQLVDLRKQEGMSRLFPHMPRSKSKGTMSAIMSKRFGYYRRSVGITDDVLDFHALRTEFHVRLARAGVPGFVRKGLMGHEQTDVTHEAYFRAGMTIGALKEYVDRNTISNAGVRPPFGRMFSPTPRPALRVVS